MGKVPRDSKEAGDDHNPETEHLNPLNYIAPQKTMKDKPEHKTKIFWSVDKTYIALLVWKVSSPRQGSVRIFRPFDDGMLKETTPEYRNLKKYVKAFCDQSHIEINFF